MSERMPPLNLTEDEVEVLWEMVKVGIGEEEIHHYDHENAESVHTKVRDLVMDE